MSLAPTDETATKTTTKTTTTLRMVHTRNNLPSDRPPGWPAWSVSLLLHACLLVVMLYWLQAPPVRSAADQPTREVGIVLKKMSDEGPRFEGEEAESEADHSPAPQKSSSKHLQAALPNPSEFPPSNTALPRLPTLGGSPLSKHSPSSIAQMSAGSAPSKSIHSEATVSLFGIEGTGSRFAYVFDRSISMAGPPLRVAKQQLIASLDALDSIHQFQIIFFNHEPQVWDLTGGQARIAFASDANKRLAEKFVHGVSATGGTFRRTALLLALRLRPDVIFFLTDTDDPMTASDLAEAIRRARRDTIAINTIEYGNGVPNPSNNNFLVQLARETGGQYIFVDTQKLAKVK